MTPETRINNIEQLVLRQNFLRGRTFTVRISLVTDEASIHFAEIELWQRDMLMKVLKNMELSHIAVTNDTFVKKENGNITDKQLLDFQSDQRQSGIGKKARRKHRKKHKGQKPPQI